jgi:hypothetical protein
MNVLPTLTNHMPAASLRRSSVVEQSASLRSCLKKQNCDKKARFHIRFSEGRDEEYPIESFKDLDLWTSDSEPKQCVVRDNYILQTDEMAREYVCLYDAAYLQVNSGDGNGAVEDHIEQALVRGVELDYRTGTLARPSFSHDTKLRNKLRKAGYKLIVAMYKSLAGRDDWDTELGMFCENHSGENRKWAAYIGRIDAIAARLEHAQLPHCIWTPPLVVANTPAQHRGDKALIKVNVATVSLLQEQLLKLELGCDEELDEHSGSKSSRVEV